MITIEEIKTYIPSNKIDLGKKYQQFDKSFLQKKIGAIKVSRKKIQENNITMCVRAYKKLKKKYNLKAIVLCTQNPTYNSLPHDSAIIHDKLKLNKNIACFDISQGCAGYIYSIKAIDNFLKLNETAAVFTCDTYSKIIKQNRNNDILFGDASSVSIVKKINEKEKRLKLISSSFYSDGKFYKTISVNKGNLMLDGKAVIKFCSTTVVDFIKNFLKENKLCINEIDKFFLHQGSKYIIDIISDKLDLSIDQRAGHILNIGNTVSSSLPILMEKKNFNQYKKIIVCGFGVGLSISIGYFKV